MESRVLNQSLADERLAERRVYAELVIADVICRAVRDRHEEAQSRVAFGAI